MLGLIIWPHYDCIHFITDKDKHKIKVSIVDAENAKKIKMTSWKMKEVSRHNPNQQETKRYKR